MFDFHEKRKIRNLVYSKVTIAVLLILIGLLSLSVFERFMTLRDISAKRANKEVELAALQEREADLSNKVEYLKKGRGVEEELRNRFDVAREGEQVVVIVGEEEDVVDADTLVTPPGTSEEESTYRWWHVLKFW